jgi:hypothetical protein
MAINVNSIQDFVPVLIAFSLRTQDTDAISSLVEREGLLPDACVERNGQIFDDYENLVCHDWIALYKFL